MVRIEKQGAVWTVVHSRFAEARNAMDPDSADALAAAFREFDADGFGQRRRAVGRGRRVLRRLGSQIRQHAL